MRKRKESETGFTMIEGLLAAVILSVGLLALSGMQAISFSRNYDANELTRVSALASEMMERIQFNRKNVASYNTMTTSGAGNCTTVVSPTVQPMASGDCVQWRAALLATNYSNIVGTIAVQAIGPASPALNQNRVTVTITWTGSVDNANSLKRTKNVSYQSIVAFD